VPNSISSQARTPPDLKWLLNERAALAGEVTKATIRSRTLAVKLEALQQQVSRLVLTAQAARRTRDSRQVVLDALDVAIGLSYESVRPDAAGVVNGWAGRYGKRGALKQFVVQALQEAAPDAVNIRDLLNQISLHFQISAQVPADRRSLKSSVTSTVSNLFKEGKVEPMHSRTGGSGPGLWRWKAPTTLSALAAKAKALSHAAAEDDSLEHLAGCAGPSSANPDPA
jgi:hypothetical protein